MFDVPVSSNVIAFARQIVEKHNLGHRRGANGTLEQQLTGLIGQTVVHDLFGVTRPSFGEKHDGGIDFTFAGKRVDVKTMGRNGGTRPEWVSTVMQVQMRSAAEILIFTSFNKPARILTVCGWMTKQQLLQRGKLFPKGSRRVRTDGSVITTRAAIYEVRNSDLIQVDTESELIESMTLVSRAMPPGGRGGNNIGPSQGI